MTGGSSSVAVVGAGNGGCAVAGELALRGFDVRLFNRSESRLARLLAQGGVAVERDGGTEFAELALITTGIEAATDGVGAIVVCAPTPALTAFAPLLAPVVQRDQTVLVNPGHTGGALFLYAALQKTAADRFPVVCETATLTHTCRMRDPGTVWIGHRVPNLLAAAMPAQDTERALEALRGLFPDLVAASSILETSLQNLNAVEHPAQMVCNAGWIESTGGNFNFYYDGTTPAVAAVIEAVDRERLSIASKFGLSLPTFVDTFGAYGYTDEEGRASKSVYRAMQRSAPNRHLKAPPDLDHRYISEDVGWGLVPWIHLARRVGVETPAMVALVEIASLFHGNDYLVSGLRLETLGLAGLSEEEIHRYVMTGATR